jgi:hypothetical protein
VRLDASRTTPGSGLGLSLVAAIARQHGASLELSDTQAGASRPGLTAILRFPSVAGQPTVLQTGESASPPRVRISPRPPVTACSGAFTGSSAPAPAPKNSAAALDQEAEHVIERKRGPAVDLAMDVAI